RMLSNKLFLDEPIRNAQHRIDNDIYQLQGVLSAREHELLLEGVRAAKQRIDNILRSSIDIHTLGELSPLFTRVLRAPDGQEEPPLDLRILGAIARAQVDSAAKREAWVGVAALTAKHSSAI